MGRKRIKDLPPNLYENNGYYQYKHPNTGKYFSLGKEKQTAIEEAQQINYALKPISDRVKKVIQHNDKKYQYFSEFIEYFKINIIPTKELSDNTVKDYLRKIPHIEKALGKKTTEQISIHDIAQFLNQFPPKQSNNYRALLSIIFKYAIAEGITKENPANATIKKTVKVQRQRLTLDGFRAIRNHAPDWLKNAMDLALLIGQRRSDLVTLRWADIHDDFIWIKQQKVDKWESGQIKIQIEGKLLALLKKCKNPSEFVLSYKDKPINADYLTKEFAEARNKCSYYAEMDNPPSFHEIRSLNAFLQKKAHIEIGKTQVLLGHTSEKMTEYYQQRHETVWQEVDKSILEKFWKFLDTEGKK